MSADWKLLESFSHLDSAGVFSSGSLPTHGLEPSDVSKHKVYIIKWFISVSTKYVYSFSKFYISHLYFFPAVIISNYLES